MNRFWRRWGFEQYTGFLIGVGIMGTAVALVGFGVFLGYLTFGKGC